MDTKDIILTPAERMYKSHLRNVANYQRKNPEKMKKKHEVYSGLGGNETTSADKEINGDEPTAQEDENDEADQVDGDKQSEITPTEVYDTKKENPKEAENDDGEMPNLVKQTEDVVVIKDDEQKGEEIVEEAPIQSIDTPAVKKMKKKELSNNAKS